jgi:hypothetical protein
MAVLESGGAHLESPRVPLPAFTANEIRAVDVPVGSPASAVASLPGAHSLTVDVSAAFAKPPHPHRCHRRGRSGCS